MSAPGTGGGPGPRVPDGDGDGAVGSKADSRRHPPHETINAEDARLKEGEGAPSADAPVLPANASGRDERSADPDEAPPIVRESMYDGRPEESKDYDPGH